MPKTPSKFTSISRLSPSSLSQNRTNPMNIHQNSEKGLEQIEMENDFELSPQLLRLHLSPTEIRQRNSISTLEKERTLWNELSGPSSGGGSLSSSPEVRSENQRRRINRGKATSNSTSEVEDEESKEDEGEDLLEGLVFPESVFGPAEDEKEGDLERGGDEEDDVSGNSNADDENEGNFSNLISKNRRKIKKKSDTLSNVGGNHSNTREKLQAMLDARSKGHQLPPRISQNDLRSNLKNRKDFDLEEDQDFGKGLIITDDLDLSPYRLKANGLSFKVRNTGMAIGAGGSKRGHSTTTSGIGRGKVQAQQGVIQQVGRAPRSRTTTSTSNTRNSNNASRKVSASSNFPTPSTSTSNPQPPLFKVTNSSPAFSSTQHQHHLSSGSNGSSNMAKSSPPRAPSAYSHLPGTGPRQQQQQQRDRNLRGEKSVGNLNFFSRVTGNAFNSSTVGTSSSAVGGSNFTNQPSSNSLLSRPRSLIRKRSLPMLSGENESKHSTSSSSNRSSKPPITSSSIGSGNLPSLPKSGSAESLHQTSFKVPTQESIKNRFNLSTSPNSITLPPARPSTPTGPMRFTLPTASSLARAQASSEQNSSALIRRPNSPYTAITATAAAARDAAVRLMRRPKRARQYGDGHELDGFDDLPVTGSSGSTARSSPTPYSTGNAATPFWRRNASPLVGSGNFEKKLGDDTIKVKGSVNPNSLKVSLF